LANFLWRYSDLLILFCCRHDKLTQRQPIYLCLMGFSSIYFSFVNNNSPKSIITVIGKIILWFPSWHAVGADFLSLMQTLYWWPYVAKFWHKTDNNQSYTLESWYGESRLWEKATWLESKSLYVTKFSIELTAASWDCNFLNGSSKQKIELFIIFLYRCWLLCLCPEKAHMKRNAVTGSSSCLFEKRPFYWTFMMK
jgi:hypothetical protein